MAVGSKGGSTYVENSYEDKNHECKLKVFEGTGEVRAEINGKFATGKVSRFVDMMTARPKKTHVTVDFSNATHIDSHGIGALILVNQHFKEPIRIIIKRGSSVAEVIGLFCMSRIFNVVEDDY